MYYRQLIWRGVMPTGRVKWFDKKKNYGFIVMDEGEKDIFFHVKGIKDPVLKNIISPDQRVVFAILKDERGERAINIESEL